MFVVPYPTFEDVERAAAEGHPEAQRDAEKAKASRARVDKEDEHRAKVQGTLPELEGEGDALDFTFAFDGGVSEGSWVIRLGEREVWRERAYYEEWPRFFALEAILKDRYGDRFRSLTPDEAAWSYLVGDSFEAAKKLPSFRKE
jgi:hypothetical protein